MGAIRTWVNSDIFYSDFDFLSRTVVTAQSYQKNFSETIRFGESVNVTATTGKIIGISEGIHITDELTKSLSSVTTRCFPMGSWMKFPAIVLQKRYRVCEMSGTGDGIVWAWAWSDWVLDKYYEFSSEPENEPRTEWGFTPLQTNEKERNAYGKLLSFYERLIPWLTIDYKTLFCDQGAWTIIEDYAYSWIETEPITAVTNTTCGADTVEYEQRRILLYPLGLDQANRQGNPVGAIEVRIVEWDFTREGGAYGVYNCHLKLEGVHALPHHIYTDITSADYAHSETEATERDRAYQGIIPWGDAGEAGAQA